jgi:GT2 family glycosyltransferase
MVGCCELNAAGVESGKSIAQFRRGMFVHNRAPEQLAGPTVWAAGGSLVIQTEVWKMLGGLDTLFRPAYYEDIDLGYRVWKAGLEVVFEPTARVFHDHESTNASVFGKAKMEVMSYKNSFLFFWKNVTDTSLWVQHFLWLPYQLLVGGWKSHGMLILGFFQAVLQIGEVLRSRHIAAKYARLSDKETMQRANEGVL